MKPKHGTTQEYDVFISACPSRDVFEHMFSKWGLLILAALSNEPMRFGSLRRKIDGISERMLSQTLQVLEKERLVIRTEWPGLPPKVEYALSDAGLRISGKVHELLQCFYDVLVTREYKED